MDIDIRPFDPKTATNEEWAAYHAYRRARHREREPDDPLLDDEAVEELMKNPDPQGEEFYFTAMRPDKPGVQVGVMVFEVFKPGSPSYEGNKHFAGISLSVLTPYRRRGIGTKLLAKVAALAREYEKTLIICHSDEPSGKAFIEAVGAQLAQRSRESRLYLDQVDWGMVEEWAEAVSGHDAGVGDGAHR